MSIINYKIFLEEFKQLGSPQAMSIFLVENITHHSRRGRKGNLLISTAAIYADIAYPNFRLIYLAKRTNIGAINYRKLVIAWLQLKLSLGDT